MPDRFNNGNPDNDNGSKEHAISRGGLDVTSKWAFHGGDMQGLEQKLDYLKEMGITAIWMTPILRNKAVQDGGFAHHGYWIVDFTEIDSHFGTNADLKSLIEAAHAKGMKIFFDIITNHTADVIKYRECHEADGRMKAGLSRCEYKSLAQVAAGDTYTPFVPEAEQHVKFPAWLNDPQYYHNQGDTTFTGENSLYGDFVGLDDLNTEDPRVLAGMIDIYKNIIREFKPDGFRIDTVRHVQMPFWQAFGPAIMDYAREQGIPNFHIFGEVYDPDPAVLSRFTTEGKLPAVLDFGFQHAAAEVFYRGKDVEVLKTLFDNDDYYNDADSQADLLLNFLGNHDMGRPGYFINRDMAAIDPAEKLQRSILSHAFMYLSRGIPVVYYGDEQGFTGDGNDVDARENMFPSRVASYNDNTLLGTEKTTADDNFDPSHPLYTALAEFAELRKNHRALRRGIHIHRHLDPAQGTLAFARVDPEEQLEYLVVFNTATTPVTVELPAAARHYTALMGEQDMTVTDGQARTELPPLSFAVYKAGAPLRASTDVSVQLAGVTAQDSRLQVRYTLGGERDNPLPLYEVMTEYRNADGSYTLIAKDYTASFSAYLPAQKVTPGAEIRVTVSNLAGSRGVEVFTLPAVAAPQ
ncbi:alpha-amylase [Exilibacterium tricleocarpae]|uniref:Alpha-amylase n=2 Tax=Exilibacterium tricleocarpae TaxID=2591008 RepID=A0A545TVW8_9GAMM|nr:alpha-amylase [Exilibacterium tricleocarpae]